MPFTFIRSSTFLNPPFFWRYSTMRSAVVLPTPGSVSSCAADAVFRLIELAAGTAALAVRRTGSCAVTAAAQTRTTRHADRTLRNMGPLLIAGSRRDLVTATGIDGGRNGEWTRECLHRFPS